MYTGLKSFRVAIVIASLFFYLIGAEAFAQQTVSRMNQEYGLEKYQLMDSPEFHTHPSIRPYVDAELLKLNDSLQLLRADTIANPYQQKFWHWTFDRVFNRPFVEIEKKDVQLYINPLFNFSGGYSLKHESKVWSNDRGFEAYGNLGKTFSFYTAFHEIQAVFPEYKTRYIQQNRIAPGTGLVKKFEYGDGYDYSYATGYISFTPSKYFNFQLGTGKNFFGNGYRSLILSDNAFSYPYLKISTEFWNLKYENLYVQLQDIQEKASQRLGYAKKYATMHYLDWAATKRLNIAVFEAIIWQAQDSAGYRGFDLSYLNPVIFYRPVEFSLGSPDNAILGMNVSYKIGRSSMAYGQIMLDEFRLKELTSGKQWWANKYAFQLGYKAYNAFKVPNLYLQAEFNTARPYIYSHWDGLQAYGHNNLPLAHTLGANFRELITIARYHYKRWYASYEFLYALYGEDKDNKSFGGDVFRSYQDRDHDYGNYIGQGLKTELFYQNFRLSYLFNPHYNLNAFMEVTYRNQKGGHHPEKDAVISFGIRTSVENIYTDF